MNSYRSPSATILVLLGTAALAGCAATGKIESFETGETIAITEQDERGLWHQSDDFDEAVRYAGVLYTDPALLEYLQQVTDRLFPEFAGKIRVHVLRSLVPNAFVIPNGSTYLDAGLLAYLDNEAQLAAIIGHEGSHFVRRHSLRSSRTAKQNLAAAAVFGSAIGLPGTAQILAYSSIMGYSRDLEREADREGFDRILNAGYDPREAVHLFERLARHAKAMDYDDPVFFSSHPKMSERIDTFRSLAAGSTGGAEIGESPFRRAAAGITNSYLEAATERGDHKALIHLLEEEDKLALLAPRCAYYLAEAYRRRDEAGDIETAEHNYRQTLDVAPDHARAHAALGTILMKSGRYAEAREHLTRYLELDPEAQDRAYIEQYIAELAGR